jgi:hypothetical protein
VKSPPIVAVADRGAQRLVLVERPRERPTDSCVALDVEVPHPVDSGLAAPVEIGVTGEPDTGAEAVGDMALHRRDGILFARASAGEVTVVGEQPDTGHHLDDPASRRP